MLVSGDGRPDDGDRGVGVQAVAQQAQLLLLRLLVIPELVPSLVVALPARPALPAVLGVFIKSHYASLGSRRCVGNS